LRSASDKKGAPPAGCTSAFTRTSGGTAGFLSIPAISVAVRLASRTDPASAVPSDAPMSVAVFSGLELSG
jgi:hypothetical protein